MSSRSSARLPPPASTVMIARPSIRHPFGHAQQVDSSNQDGKFRSLRHERLTDERAHTMDDLARLQNAPCCPETHAQSKQRADFGELPCPHGRGLCLAVRAELEQSCHGRAAGRVNGQVSGLSILRPALLVRASLPGLLQSLVGDCERQEHILNIGGRSARRKCVLTVARKHGVMACLTAERWTLRLAAPVWQLAAHGAGCTSVKCLRVESVRKDSNTCGCVPFQCRHFFGGSEYEPGPRGANEDAAAGDAAEAEIPTASADDPGNEDPDGRARRRPGHARDQTRCRANTSRQPPDCCLGRRT
jgi:hypothetical protein